MDFSSGQIRSAVSNRLTDLEVHRRQELFYILLIIPYFMPPTILLTFLHSPLSHHHKKQGEPSRSRTRATRRCSSPQKRDRNTHRNPSDRRTATAVHWQRSNSSHCR